VNWIKLFILGLLLAMSPFQLSTESYIFHYSLFGYGLILVAYLFKKKDWKDWIIFASCAALTVFGFLDLFTIYYLFIFLFSGAVTLFYFADSGNRVLSSYSLGLIGAAAVLCGLVAANALPVPLFGSIILIAPYLFCSSLIAMFVLDHKSFSK
jgi:hypothetical protein